MDNQIKVLQKGKITIPTDVRERLGIKEGDYLTLEVRGNKLILLPPKTMPNPTEVLSGLAEGVSIMEPVKKELRGAVATRVKKKISRSMK